MSNPTTPDTVGTLDAIVSFLTALTYSDGVTLVYTPLIDALNNPVPPVQEGRFRDIGTYLPDNSTNTICEVWPADDDNELYGFGGPTRDTQTFLIMSLVSMTSAKGSVRQIVGVRDALIPFFREHVTLQATGNITTARFKKGSGKWTPVAIGGKTYLGYGFGLEVISDWTAPLGILA
jgi:hypothetical protein